ncbi:MAG: hypothetical protein LWY06_14175 [Firmicutes bacterium]|nr:hypothetical protein [Bacillota bacterium]
MINTSSQSIASAAPFTYTGSAAPAKSAEASEKPVVSSDSFTKSFSSNGISSYQFRDTMKKVATVGLGVMGAIGGAIGGAMAGTAGGAIGGVVLGVAGAVTGGLAGIAIYAHGKSGFEGLAAGLGGAVIGAVGGAIGGAVAGVSAGAVGGVVGGICGAVAGGVGGAMLSDVKISFGS